MSFSQLFKKVLIPCAAGVAVADGHTLGPNCIKRSETKPSKLPIYSSECNVCEVVAKKPLPPPSGVEETVGNIRKELWVWQDNLRGYRHKIVDVYTSSFSRVSYVVDYLREEAHGPQRAGAIGVSGLAGYVFGMRKGIVRRFLYASCGALAMAAICYPNEAVEYLDAGIQEGKRYFIVAYHFVYGETPKTPEWLKIFQAERVSVAKEEKASDEHKTK